VGEALSPYVIAMQKPAFELPAGYGELVETLKVSSPNVEGTLFVHAQANAPGARVASLRLKAGVDQVTFKHLWQPKSEQLSRNGSRLLFRNAPNTQRGESWESESFKARRVAVYEGRQGPFAVTPFGILSLERRAPEAAPAFDVAAFQGTASTMRAAVQSHDDAPTPKPAQPESDPTDAKVLDAIKARQGDKGVRWDDLLATLQAQGTGAEAAEASLQRLMDKGQAYEPTLGILKST
jgi:hypothetical protein